MAASTQIQSLLESRNPDDVGRGLSMLKSFDGVAADYARTLTRQAIYSGTTCVRDPEIVDAFLEVTKVRFSTAAMNALIARAEEGFASRESRRAFDE